MDDPDARLPARLTAGRGWPLGAQVDARGVNFAVFAAHAQAIDLCLFDESGTHEIARAVAQRIDRQGARIEGLAGCAQRCV